jgi:hypothetical protein
MESNWQMNQSLTPNDPKQPLSNFAISKADCVSWIWVNLSY